MSFRKEVLDAVEKSWGPDTVYSGPVTKRLKEFYKENPAFGQCIVSSLVIQDYLGGEILCSGNHFWNRLSSGIEVDVSRKQFKRFEPARKIYVADRSFAMNQKPTTKNRYKILKNRVEKRLNDN